MTEEPPPALLGFAIPVYNRPQLLDLALASLVPQAERIGAPIYFPDDSCGPANVEVVARWQRRYGGIVHEINAQNIGIDANIDRAIVRCPARYVLVIGDDDIVFPGLVDALLDVLRGESPPHILCSYLYLDNKHAPISGRPVLPASAHDQPFGRIVVEHGWSLGFIGAHVFCRERYRSCAASAMGSYFNHVAKLLAYLEPGERIPLVAEPLVGNRADDEGTPTWSGDRLNVVFGLERVLHRFMATRYLPADIEAAVANARAHLGYAQTIRLLYWAALAEASGRGAGYWSSLESLVPSPVYRRLRCTPRPLLRALRWAFPLLRRIKRRLARGYVTPATVKVTP